MSLDLHEAPTSAREIHVLHVDDDRSVLDLTSAFLDSELETVSVTTVTSPEEALDHLDAGQFNCVISDYDMPGMESGSQRRRHWLLSEGRPGSAAPAGEPCRAGGRRVPDQDRGRPILDCVAGARLSDLRR